MGDCIFERAAVTGEWLCVDVACLSGYGGVGRLLVVILEGISLQASDDDGKTS